MKVDLDGLEAEYYSIISSKSFIESMTKYEFFDFISVEPISWKVLDNFLDVLQDWKLYNHVDLMNVFIKKNIKKFT